MKTALGAILILFATLSLCWGQDPAPEGVRNPEDVVAWSKAIGQIFDMWWDRILLVLSVLINAGLLSTRKGRGAAIETLTLGKVKAK